MKVFGRSQILALGSVIGMLLVLMVGIIPNGAHSGAGDGLERGRASGREAEAAYAGRRLPDWDAALGSSDHS